MHTPPTTAPIFVRDASDEHLIPYRNLKDVAARVAGTFIAESELVLRRVLDAGHDIRSILLTESRYARLESVFHETSVRAPIFVTTPEILHRVVGFPLHRGVLALVTRPSLPTLTQILPTAGGVVVVLEDVVDPDNVGSVFRHAAGFGAHAVVLTEHAGDPLYRKAVRTSMGWVLDVAYTRLGPGPDVIDQLTGHGYLTVALTPDRNAVPLDEIFDSIGSAAPVALILGAESPGLKPETLERSTYRARIPMTGHVDSLNIATAAAIALYELRRSRPLP